MADEIDYWMSFRIADERSSDGRTYNERYTTLVASYNSASTMVWDETTSFALLRSQWDIDQLSARLKKAIDPSRDMVLIRTLGQQTARLAGVYHDGDLNKFLPYLKKA